MLHLLGATGLINFSFNNISLKQIFRETEDHVMFNKTIKLTSVFTICLFANMEENLKTGNILTFYFYFHRVKPSFLEYLSYLLNFMSVIAGPCNNFKDYIAFIEGRHTHMKLLEVNRKQKDFHSLPEPSPTVSF